MNIWSHDSSLCTKRLRARGLWATPVLAFYMWNGITLVSVKAVREARFFRPMPQKIAASADKQLTAQPGCYSASGLAL